MIISEKHNFLFLHVPKTGGTTAEAALSPVLSETDTIPLRSQMQIRRLEDGAVGRRPNVRPEGLSDAAWLKRHRTPQFLQNITRAEPGVDHLTKHSDVEAVKAFFTPEFYDRAVKCIFVRHPYERTYSAYRFKMTKSKTSDPLYEALFPNGQPIGFDAFLTSGLWRRVLAARPQFHWFDATAANTAVYKTSDMGQALHEIAETHLALPPEQVAQVDAVLQEGRKNVSTRPDEWRSMSAAARKMIDEIYSKDFELFGFE
ncbi:sulfotransferase family 2 domain-containing protein [Alisedimentitalea sp. MJ-SS2]|uniref:sulfotransferase family 2 domain-containing protein n=1 Tax=Aliisedimentitalea sp. MJ-SS2 TaxID=3049795 RepID=UPI0029061882|nr:sulfotransferase family 2 domain-containing protein [Alisedimentitalea sp. MJ-SS2]MDU8930010.1 sulfotransferase family 2 domain-containing protein [Alisedimentitalea sp. MJ-SS2]